MSWSYAEARSFLADRIDPTIPPGARRAASLDRMRALCAALGDPQRAAPAVHVTGTNGKGSVARLATALLVAEGLTVGTTTSPDLGSPNERIAIDLAPIADDDFASVLAAVADADARSGAGATYVELLHAAAFAWFAACAVDVAIVEVGRGGRRDATNVVDGVIAVVTNVGMDHADVIGPTRADIAFEKAGIVERGATLVLGETDPGLVPVFEAEQPAALWLRDRDFGCTRNDLAPDRDGRRLALFTPAASYADVHLSLHGAHQGDNAAVALAAVEALLRTPLRTDAVRTAFAEAVNPGRFEIVRRNPLVVLDGAHDADAAAAAAATLRELAPTAGVVLVVGLLEPHDPSELLAAFGGEDARLVVATAPDSPRALPADGVAAAARALGTDSVVVPGVPDAVAAGIAAAGPADAVLVAGSLYLVAEARQAGPYDDPP